MSEPTWSPLSVGPNSWKPTRVATNGGRHLILIARPGRYHNDVTFYAGTPTKCVYTSADPFGDSTSQLTFPQLTAFEDGDSFEPGYWLGDDASVDIWWIPAMAKPDDWPTDIETEDMSVYHNPLSGKFDLIAPAYEYEKVAGVWTRTATKRGTKVWEGFVASEEVAMDEDSDSISLQCQGALYQADCYLAKPFYPPRPQTLESLILGVFNRTHAPHLRTAPPVIDWPAGWTYVAPSFTGSSNTFDPNVSPGKKWTGYTTRQTGAWDHALTGFVQQLLATMLVKANSGVPAGDQWTLRLAREGDPTHPAGRTPVLTVRARNRAADFAMWVGTPGLTGQLTRDSTQKADIIYGTGTDLGGTTWRNAALASDGSRTDFLPLAAVRDVYPANRNNKNLNLHRIPRESYVQYGTGFSQVDATTSAEQTLQRDRDPGWSGTLTLKVDPSATLSRWELTAGMTMRLQGFRGTGADGLHLHIAQVEADPSTGAVTLTVDSRFRDLLTLSEAIARTRDALTPARLLQLNRNSVTIEDIQAPWDYSKGSGFVPRAYHVGAKHRASTDRFPYSAWNLEHPPRHYPGWYVSCHAAAPKSKDRWVGPIQVLMAEKGTIRRAEFACYDHLGHLLAIPFHVSLYYNNGIDSSFMPHDDANYDPLTLTGAFESIDPATGEPWTVPGRDPDQSIVMGWGNKEQPAGYSPGLKTRGTKPTGMLVDESSWTFDCSSNNPNYDHLAKAGKEVASVISVYAMFYADYTSTVYFQGRLYREEPGTQ